MDTFPGKLKCISYLFVVTLVCVFLGVSYEITGTLHGNVRLTVDYKGFCEHFPQKMCASEMVSNVTDCMQAMEPNICEKRLLDWENRVNEECSWEINEFFGCKGKKECEGKREKAKECVEKVERPEWFPVPNLQEADGRSEGKIR